MRPFLKIMTLLAITLSSCQKDITVPQPPYENKVSVQSLIEPDSAPRVYFNRTVPFFDKKVYNSELVVRNAAVKVTGAGVTDVLQLDSSYDKIRCDYFFWYQGLIPISTNTEYTLSIEYEGKTLSATATTNLQAVIIDSVGYTPAFNDLYGEHEGVLTYFKDVPGQVNYYRYEMIRPVTANMVHATIQYSATCLGSDTVTVLEFGRSVYNDINLDGQQIKLIVEPAFTHAEGLETEVSVATIDKNAYNFLDQLDKQKLGVYNPFVEPVFLIDGQFGDKAIGFFGSMKRSEAIDFIFPE